MNTKLLVGVVVVLVALPIVALLLGKPREATRQSESTRPVQRGAGHVTPERFAQALRDGGIEVEGVKTNSRITETHKKYGAIESHVVSVSDGKLSNGYWLIRFNSTEAAIQYVEAFRSGAALEEHQAEIREIARKRGRGGFVPGKTVTGYTSPRNGEWVIVGGREDPSMSDKAIRIFESL